MLSRVRAMFPHKFKFSIPNTALAALLSKCTIKGTESCCPRGGGGGERAVTCQDVTLGWPGYVPRTGPQTLVLGPVIYAGRNPRSNNLDLEPEELDYQLSKHRISERPPPRAMILVTVP